VHYAPLQYPFHFLYHSLLLKLLIQLQNDNHDDELISARLLLLCTYGTNLDFVPLFEEHHLAEIINAVGFQAIVLPVYDTNNDDLERISTCKAYYENIEGSSTASHRHSCM
jgi:hypothetical protein